MRSFFSEYRRRTRTTNFVDSRSVASSTASSSRSPHPQIPSSSSISDAALISLSQSSTSSFGSTASSTAWVQRHQQQQQQRSRGEIVGNTRYDSTLHRLIDDPLCPFRGRSVSVARVNNNFCFQTRPFLFSQRGTSRLNDGVHLSSLVSAIQFEQHSLPLYHRLHVTHRHHLVHRPLPHRHPLVSNQSHQWPNCFVLLQLPHLSWLLYINQSIWIVNRSWPHNSSTLQQ